VEQKRRQIGIQEEMRKDAKILRNLIERSLDNIASNKVYRPRQYLAVGEQSGYRKLA
jgi:hypothetical protein